MSNMTVEYLAKLGRERTISPLFERVWTIHGRSNPVAAAIEIVDNQRRGRNKRCLSTAMLFIIVPLCFAVAGAVAYSHEDKIALFRYLILAAFLVGAFLEISVVREEKTAMHDDAITMVDDFCKHLTLVDEWAGCDSSSKFYLYRNEDKIKEIGTNILVRAGIEVLQLQKMEKEVEPGEIREHYQEMAGHEMTEFSRRYDALKRIGLASGGYDKYFEQAQHIIDVDSARPPRLEPMEIV